jgi:prepilin-type N-terminal cleavage/methylation domain-containing protein
VRGIAMTVRVHSRNGWSLLEALIVLAIAGIIATIGYAYLISSVPHAQLEQAEIMVHRVLADARNKAVSEELVTKVVFDVANKELWVEWTDPDSATVMSLPHTVLPERVSFENSGIPGVDGEVSFTPRGSLVSGGSTASGGTITLVNTAGETFVFHANVSTGSFPLAGGNLR